MHLILHIGTEKTGTTTIQQDLYANAAALRRQGIGLLETAGHPNNRRLPAWFRDDDAPDEYARSRGFLDAEAKRAYFSDWPAALDAEIASLKDDCHTLIVSSEHFHSRLPHAREVERAAEFFRPRFDSIEVLVYLRRQDRLLESVYSTALKVGRGIGIRGFFRRVIRNEAYFDFHALLERWSAAFGRSALRVGIYDRELLADRDITADFRRRVGIVGDHPPPDARANAALPHRAGSALVAVNSVFGQPPRSSFEEWTLRRRIGHKLRWRLIHRPPRLLASGGPLRLPEDLRSRAGDYYAESNRRLWNDYFDGEPRW